jgi:four helix bundle protein
MSESDTHIEAVIEIVGVIGNVFVPVTVGVDVLVGVVEGLTRGLLREEGMSGKFHAYEVAMEMAAAPRPLLETLGRRDRDLASQLRRAAASGVLNIAEGSGRWGKDRVQHSRIAAGSAAEAMAALGLARAWGLLDGRLIQGLETLPARVRAMPWRLAQGRR